MMHQWEIGWSTAISARNIWHAFLHKKMYQVIAHLILMDLDLYQHLPWFLLCSVILIWAVVYLYICVVFGDLIWAVVYLYICVVFDDLIWAVVSLYICVVFGDLIWTVVYLYICVVFFDLIWAVVYLYICVVFGDLISERSSISISVLS
jgi:hypothetical protein